MKQLKEKKVVVYYQVITPESAEHGDFAETGLEVEISVEPDRFEKADGESAVDLALKALTERVYATEPSSSHFHSGLWYSTVDPERDFQSGAETYFTAHLEGFSESEEAEVYKRLCGKGAA